jgi:hypothetical protein
MLIVLQTGICIKMDGYIIPSSGQLLGLINNGLRVFVAQ